MSASRPDPIDLAATYIHLADGGAGEAVPVTADFWPQLMSGERRYPGRLVTAGDMTGDMTHWEMHPAGEELLIVLSGAATLLLDEPTGERSVRLGQGEAYLVPRGIWHRFLARGPARVLFVTYGEGTEHRAL